MNATSPQPPFILATPGSTSPAHTADLLGLSAAAAAIMWNCHLAHTGPEQFLRTLTSTLRIPPQRPMITTGTRYDGAMVRMATRAYRIANELADRATPTRSGQQGMYVEAFNEYLSRRQQRQ
ncbi:MAG: hypothetical protein WCE30_21865 [Mycobacterium sp.]